MHSSDFSRQDCALLDELIVMLNALRNDLVEISMELRDLQFILDQETRLQVKSRTDAFLDGIAKQLKHP